MAATKGLPRRAVDGQPFTDRVRLKSVYSLPLVRLYVVPRPKKGS